MRSFSQLWFALRYVTFYTIETRNNFQLQDLTLWTSDLYKLKFEKVYTTRAFRRAFGTAKQHFKVIIETVVHCFPFFLRGVSTIEPNISVQGKEDWARRLGFNKRGDYATWRLESKQRKAQKVVVEKYSSDILERKNSHFEVRSPVFSTTRPLSMTTKKTASHINWATGSK